MLSENVISLKGFKEIVFTQKKKKKRGEMVPCQDLVTALSLSAPWPSAGHGSLSPTFMLTLLPPHSS